MGNQADGFRLTGPLGRGVLRERFQADGFRLTGPQGRASGAEGPQGRSPWTTPPLAPEPRGVDPSWIPRYTLLPNLHIVTCPRFGEKRPRLA